jgi:hypothetical protein
LEAALFLGDAQPACIADQIGSDLAACKWVIPARPQAAGLSVENSPTAVEVMPVAPSITPGWFGILIHPRCCINGIFIYDHACRRDDHRPANHDRLGDDRSLPFHDDRRRLVLVGMSFPLISVNFTIRSDCQIGGNCR